MVPMDRKASRSGSLPYFTCTHWTQYRREVTAATKTNGPRLDTPMQRAFHLRGPHLGLLHHLLRLVHRDGVFRRAALAHLRHDTRHLGHVLGQCRRYLGAAQALLCASEILLHPRTKA